MAVQDSEKSEKKPRILLAPLDWGLGHTTRCIPLIREFLEQNCEMWIAANEIQQAVLKAEFPFLNFLFLPGYQVRYSRTGRGLFWKMLVQLPKIFRSARRENKWLKKMVNEINPDVIISDNRFGFYSKAIPSIFITHQLQIETRLGKTSEKILRRLNFKYINRFSECWIPDAEGEQNLAGELSHPRVKPKIKLRYLDLLSRFQHNQVLSPMIKNHLLILLSGPEPQRTILEDQIIREIAHYPATATIVRGLPTALNQIPSTGMIKFYNHLAAKDLQNEIEKAEWVIGRCGYSTVMDMMKLCKKSILIPTPGQTEQEYLAQHLSENQLAFCIDQKEFSINYALQQASAFDFKSYCFEKDRLKTVVKNFMNGILLRQ